MPFRLSVILAEPKRISFPFWGKWHLLRASFLFLGLNRLVLMGLGILITVSPVSKALFSACPFSHWLQVTKVMGAYL